MLRTGVLGGALGVLGYRYLGAHLRPVAGSSYGRIPNVRVFTHDGQSFHLYDDLVKGRVVTFNVFFVGCGEL